MCCRFCAGAAVALMLCRVIVCHFVHQIIAIVRVQAGEYPAGGKRHQAHQHKGVAKGVVQAVALVQMAKALQQQSADGDAKADGQLLVYPHQAAAAAGLAAAQIGNGEGVHAGKL